jgi:hypothetical protein
MLYVPQVAVCSQINTKHINTVWAERESMPTAELSVQVQRSTHKNLSVGSCIILIRTQCHTHICPSIIWTYQQVLHFVIHVGSIHCHKSHFTDIKLRFHEETTLTATANSTMCLWELQKLFRFLPISCNAFVTSLNLWIAICCTYT